MQRRVSCGVAFREVGGRRDGEDFAEIRRVARRRDRRVDQRRRSRSGVGFERVVGDGVERVRQDSIRLVGVGRLEAELFHDSN